MRTFRQKQRIRLIIFGLVLLALSTSLVGFALKDGIEFYRSPTQLQNINVLENEKFRLGGMVEENSLRKKGGEVIQFKVTDFEHSIMVVYKGILPDLFSENEGVIATGVLKDEIFYASEILAKHDESYMPREVADTLKKKNNEINN